MLRICHSFLFLLGLFIVFLWPAPVFSRQVPLTSLSEIRELSTEQAGQNREVRVEGQIVWRNPFNGNFFLYSEGVGIYVGGKGASPDSLQLSVGERVRVTGVTDAGYYAPSLTAHSVEALGPAPLPPARPFHAYELYSTRNDCDWVQLIGRIKSMRIFDKKPGSGGPVIVLTVEFLNQSITVQVSLVSGEAEAQARKLMFSRVKFNAVAGTQFNMNRQIVGRNFYVNSLNDFQIVDAPDTRSGRVEKQLHELARNQDNLLNSVKTHGVVTHVDGQDVYLRGEHASLKVKVREAGTVSVGDYVEVTGFAEHGPISPTFLAREVRVVEARTAPEPVPMELNDALRARWDIWPESYLNQELVALKAELLQVTKSFGLSTGEEEHMLLCRQGQYVFTVKLPFDPQCMDGLKPGAMLMVQGICNLTRSAERTWRLYVDWFWIQPRDAADITVLEPAPWWTTAHLFGMLAVLLGVAALFLIWNIALRRTVGNQTHVIAEKVQHETIYNERQRIARELHDNLLQGLVGMAIQLKGCFRGLELNMMTLKDRVDALSCSPEERKHIWDDIDLRLENTRKSMQGVQAMLDQCSEESRASVLYLRSGMPARMGLVAALKEVLEPLGEASGVDLEIAVEGRYRPLIQEVERNLMLAVKEAVTNAVKHADAARIQVGLTYTEDTLQIHIKDNGLGFAVDEEPAHGKYGLQGMRERMKQLGGSVEIDSVPGRGTEIIIRMNLMKEWGVENG